MLNEVKKQSLSQKVYEKLESSIFDGEYKEGELFPSENFLSLKLKVSRVVVRQALQKLRDNKYIVTYKGKGSFVANPKNYNKSLYKEKIDYKTFKETMSFRALIEIEAIKSLNQLKDGASMKRILSKAQEMCNEQIGMDVLSEQDYLFHLEIVKSSGNYAYIKAFEDFRCEIISCFTLMNSLVESKSYMIDLHVNIAKSLVNGDFSRAIELIKNNEEYNLARIKELLNNGEV